MMYFRMDFGIQAFARFDPDQAAVLGSQRTGKLPVGNQITVGDMIRAELVFNGKDASEVFRHSEFNQDIVLTHSGLPANTPVRMEPGEVKVFTNSQPGVRSYGDSYRMVLTEAVSDHAFSGGLSLSRWQGNRTSPTDPMTLQSNEWLEIVFDYRGGPNSRTEDNRPFPGGLNEGEYSFLTTYLLSRGDTANLPEGESTNSPGLRYFMLYPDAYNSGFNGGLLNRRIILPYSAISNRGGSDSDPEKHYIGYTDFYMKPSRGEHYHTEVFTHHSTRAMSLNPENSGAVGKNGNRLPKIWGLRLGTEHEVASGMEPRDRLSFGGDGRGVWGRSLHTHSGNPRVVLYDVPTAPLTSIGQLQHLNHALHVWEPAYAVGNSLASPYLPRDQIWNMPTEPAGEPLRRMQFDTSYLMNRALWDRFFFSSISRPATATGYDTLMSLDDAITRWEEQPLNPRVVPLGGSTRASRLQALSESNYAAHGPQTRPSDPLPHNRVAEFYGLAGAFNVNSVSVEAWKAILGSLNAGDMDITDDQGRIIRLTLADTLRHFPRSARLAGGSGAGSDDRWTGPGNLTPARVNTLAENIVAEIKDRARAQGAPFPSLASFVNRKVENTPFGLSGVLQSAIDRGTSGAGFNQPLLDQEGVPAHVTVAHDVPGLFLLTDRYFINYPSPGHFRNNSAAGISQYISQADILSVIGSQLTVRSDTFVIRAHGSVGEQAAVAWCEAVVQRLPDYINPEADAPHVQPAQLGDPANQTYGRRFRIVSFRWLNEDEI